MSWVNDLASSLGIPGGAAVLAVAMYAGCVAAEKAARPEALKDIARILMDTSMERSARPSDIIERVFKWTFGERQLSWKCVRRTALASGILSFAIATTYHSIWRIDFQEVSLFHYFLVHPDPMFPLGGLSIGLCAVILFSALIPDYIAVAKTRVLLNLIGHKSAKLSKSILVISDIALSLFISIAFSSFAVAGAIVLVRMGHEVPTIRGTFSSIAMSILTTDVGIRFSTALTGQESMLKIIFDTVTDIAQSTFTYGQRSGSLLPVFVISTLFTSIWTILILLSSTVLKLLAPVHQFTAWFFDVDKHPVQAIGIVAGTLVMICSLIWTVLRAVI